MGGFQRTKIVCTIGPVSKSPELIEELIEAGMNVARLNFSHGTHDEHRQVIKTIHRLSEKKGRPVGILQDLAGPKIRVGPIKAGQAELKPNAKFVLTGREVVGNARRVSVSYKGLPQEVKAGDTILLADGSIELKVLENTEHDITCRVVIGGVLTSSKGLNLPQETLKIPIITEKDVEDLEFGLENGVDFIALSFVRDASDIEKAKGMIRGQGAGLPVIAKIERHEALENIDGIMEVVDGIMVARGDLGVEMSLEQIPLIQKMLIAKANEAGKPVITATQMLKSMVESPRPTRAEVADVANAILDGTDALMLSEETATGKYPVEAVRMMSLVAEETEKGLPYGEMLAQRKGYRKEGIPEAIGHAACWLAQDLQAAGIIAPTQSGQTARLVARYRPQAPIIAISPSLSTVRRLSLSWGVYPLLTDELANTDSMIERAKEVALNSGMIRPGDRIVITAGLPIGVPGTTNLIKATAA